MRQDLQNRDTALQANTRPFHAHNGAGSLGLRVVVFQTVVSSGSTLPRCLLGAYGDSVLVKSKELAIKYTNLVSQCSRSVIV